MALDYVRLGGIELLLIGEVDKIEVRLRILHLLFLGRLEGDAPADLIGVVPKERLLLLQLQRTSLRKLVQLVLWHSKLRDLRVAAAA